MKVETDAGFSRFVKVCRDGAKVTTTGRSFHASAGDYGRCDVQ